MMLIESLNQVDFWCNFILQIGWSRSATLNVEVLEVFLMIFSYLAGLRHAICGYPVCLQQYKNILSRICPEGSELFGQ